MELNGVDPVTTQTDYKTVSPNDAEEKDLARRLQKARKQAGLTQQQLCQKASLSYSTLAKIERGAIKAPSIFTIKRIAAVLGISLDELTGATTAVPEVATAKLQSKSGVKFVFFDINGCLVRFFPRAFTKLAEDSGIPADVIETAFWHYNDLVCKGEMSLEDFNQKLAEHLKLSHVDWQKYYMEAVDPIPQMHELLRWASERYHVGLLSNIMPGFIEIMRSRGLIPDIPYSAIIDSSQIGAIKPEPRAYEIAQQQTNCQPAEILLVDDSNANIIEAEKLGWHVIWFDDYRPGESAQHVRAALQPADQPIS